MCCVLLCVFFYDKLRGLESFFVSFICFFFVIFSLLLNKKLANPIGDPGFGFIYSCLLSLFQLCFSQILLNSLSNIKKN